MCSSGGTFQGGRNPGAKLFRLGLAALIRSPRAPRARSSRTSALILHKHSSKRPRRSPSNSEARLGSSLWPRASAILFNRPRSTRETKLLQDREYRLEWAEKIGMGFDLPTRSIGQLGQLIPFRKVG